MAFDYAKGCTTQEHIDNAESKNLDVLSVFAEEFNSDADGRSSQIISLYARANEDERAVMDALLIDICGWSMGSLIAMANERGYIEE